ncbi:MAG: thioredoxin family protein [Myxococcales bacterium]|nr:thioredoxin family protein [Myxococcales bacterium]
MKHFALIALLALAAAACQPSTPKAETDKPVAAQPNDGKPADQAAADKPADKVADKPAADKAAAPAMSAAVGKPAPDFSLTSLDGKPIKLSDHQGKVVVLEWFNPGCPFVKAAHEHGSLKTLAKDNASKEVVWLAINSGAPGKQGHGKEANTAGREAFGLDHPILFDEDGKVGKMYGAERTPHMYVIDAKGTLIYRGALDNTGSGRPEDVDTVENYVQQAIDAAIKGAPVKTPETKAYGCSVKYAG